MTYASVWARMVCRIRGGRPGCGGRGRIVITLVDKGPG